MIGKQVLATGTDKSGNMVELHLNPSELGAYYTLHRGLGSVTRRAIATFAGLDEARAAFEQMTTVQAVVRK